MDYEAGEYKRLSIRQFPARELRETAEGKYWKQFRAPLSAQQASWCLLKSSRARRTSVGRGRPRLPALLCVHCTLKSQ